MPHSITQARKQLSALIAAAQWQPQVITKRNKPVAVLVSPDYFRRSKSAPKPVAENFYSQLLRLRQTLVPLDETGLAGSEADTRQSAWPRVKADGE
jgi:prevent-host-death family protein